MPDKADTSTTATKGRKPLTKAEADARDARNKALDKAKYSADRAIIAEHKSDWNTLVQNAMADAGFEWTPPLTAEQKAEADLEALLAAHPGLASKFTAPIEVGVPTLTSPGDVA